MPARNPGLVPPDQAGRLRPRNWAADIETFQLCSMDEVGRGAYAGPWPQQSVLPIAGATAARQQLLTARQRGC